MRNAVLVREETGRFPYLYDFVRDGERVVEAKRRGKTVGAKLMPWSRYENTVRDYYLSLPITQVDGVYFEEQLNVLPPLGWRQEGNIEWFFIREFDYGSWTEQVLVNYETEKVYAATVDYADPTTWIQSRLRLR